MGRKQEWAKKMKVDLMLNFVSGGLILFLLFMDIQIGIVMALFYGGIDFITTEYV
jgi:hypothetical protein